MSTAQDMILETSLLLGISKTKLAALLCVTEKSLFDWRNRNVQDLPPKAKRLLRLYAVSKVLQAELVRRGESAELLDVLTRGLVPTPDGTEVTLVDYVARYPEEFGWPANVSAALNDYLVTRRHKNERNRARIAGAAKGTEASR